MPSCSSFKGISSFSPKHCENFQCVVGLEAVDKEGDHISVKVLQESDEDLASELEDRASLASGLL